MSLQDKGITKAQLRIGSGKGAAVADEHFYEVAGSRDFYVYVTPHSKAKGYKELKVALELDGCTVQVSESAPMLPGKGYKAVKITHGGAIIDDEALKRAHRWAHQRNYLHSFFKPLKSG